MRSPAVALFTIMLITLLAAELSLPEAKAETEASQPAASDDILFYSSFDKSNEPEIHSGEGGFQESAPSIYVPGRKGQALITGHYRSVSYSVAGNLQAKEGTVVFWVMPFNWRGTDETFHHFFQLPEGRQAAAKATSGSERQLSFLLYKFSEWPIIIAHGMGGELAGDRLLRTPMDPMWAPKQWHQIAFTWDEDGSSLYMDGSGQTMRYREDAPTSLGAERFRLGGPYFAPNASLTAIDELTIYRRKLSPQEIKAKYQAEKE